MTFSCSVHAVYLYCVDDCYSAKLLSIEVSDDKDYEDIFVSAPAILPLTQRLVQITLISFTDVKVDDFFSQLVNLKLLLTKLSPLLASIVNRRQLQYV